MISVLVAKHQRLVLWGCEVGDDRITAQLFYCDLHLPKSIKVSNRAGDRVYQIEIPEALQGQTFPKKGQKIQLRIIKDA